VEEVVAAVGHPQNFLSNENFSNENRLQLAGFDKSFE